MKRYKRNKTPSKPSKELIDYFPRGTSSKDDFSFNNAIIDHSRENRNLLSRKRKIKNESKSKNKETEKKTEFEINENEKIKSRVMLPKFSKGDLVLLSISEIYKDYMICDYSRNKKAMIHSSYSGLNLNNNDSFINYFSIGQFLIGAVINSGGDIQIENEGGRLNKKLLICIDPKIVNTGLKIEKITVGMDLYGQLNVDNKGNYYADFMLSSDNYESDDSESEESEENENEENENEESEEINTSKKKNKKNIEKKKKKSLKNSNKNENENEILLENEDIKSDNKFLENKSLISNENNNINESENLSKKNIKNNIENVINNLKNENLNLKQTIKNLKKENEKNLNKNIFLQKENENIKNEIFTLKNQIKLLNKNSTNKTKFFFRR